MTSQTEHFDIVLTNGRVIDPETYLDGSYNVGIRGGQIAAKYNQPTYTHIQNLPVVEPNSGRNNTVELIGLTAAICANLWARQTLRPTSITLLPAIVLLVSGSIGFRGLVAIAVGQTATGEQQFLQMFVVALTTAAGLLVGNTIVKPKITL